VVAVLEEVVVIVVSNDAEHSTDRERGLLWDSGSWRGDEGGGVQNTSVLD
jgi:hypothetical protein